jgi:hypothetical protein
MHEEYVHAGSDVVLAFTVGNHPGRCRLRVRLLKICVFLEKKNHGCR